MSSGLFRARSSHLRLAKALLKDQGARSLILTYETPQTGDMDRRPATADGEVD
jgi:hypothetical protein